MDVPAPLDGWRQCGRWSRVVLAPRCRCQAFRSPKGDGDNKARSHRGDHEI